ncbi:MAG: MGMT family protein [Firmicutes bacterium]|nr:MGMT family protein [Bacillota bacterium]
MPFFNDVYDVVKSIPPGHVMSYGRVAMMAGKPRAARMVGWALHTNPDNATIPCHRVVFRDGSLASGFAFGGPGEQRRLLESEGIEFTNERVPQKFFL